MVFSSVSFLFGFLPITLLGLVILRRRSLQNTWLLAMSVVFYIWGGGSAVLVLAYVTAVAFAAGMLPWMRWRLQRRTVVYRTALGISIAAVLAPLLFYKYLPPVSGLIGGVIPADLILPLGISFFTFHGISYIVDTAKGTIERERNVRDFALYLFVFPHQIAGPIVRYAEIRDEIKRDRGAPLDETALGLARFSWGLAKKVVVADPVGMLADRVFALSASGVEITAADAWLGAALYAIQIYFDFSAYSDMAIGLALVMGFRFPENFDQPYRSISVTEFWRRWHMTLSRWFRDYVYIPMGGNRHGLLRGTLALLTVFLLTALWHGAAFTFLIWGAIHSAMLLIERATGLRSTRRFAVPRRIGMLVFIVVSWVPFRSTSVEATLHHWGAMFGGSLDGLSPLMITYLTPSVLLAVAIAVISLIGPSTQTGFGSIFGGRSVTELPRIRMRLMVAATAVLLIVGVGTALWSDFSPFLYFQF